MMKLEDITYTSTLNLARQVLDLQSESGRFHYQNIHLHRYRYALEYMRHDDISFQLQQMVAGLIIQHNINSPLCSELKSKYKLH